MVVLGIMGVLTAMAGLQIAQSRATLQGDGAMRVVLAQMRTAREMAITERRNMVVAFIGTAAIRVVREEVPGPTTTTLSTVGIENNIEFNLTAGLLLLPASVVFGWLYQAASPLAAFGFSSLCAGLAALLMATWVRTGSPGGDAGQLSA